jgi:hypothetical protein
VTSRSASVRVMGAPAVGSPNRDISSEPVASPPLLSLDASAREARRLRWWSEADQARLGDTIQTVLREWATSWGVSSPGRGKYRGDADSAAIPGPGNEIEIQPVSIAAAEVGWTDLRWESMRTHRELGEVWWTLRTPLGIADIGRASDEAHIGDPRQAPRALYRAMFGEISASSAGSGLVEDLAHTAWMDWCGRLAALASPDGETACTAGPATQTSNEAGQSVANRCGVRADILKPWSGALTLSVTWCDQTMLLLMGPDYVATVLRRAGVEPASPAGPSHEKLAPLVPLLRAVGAKSLSLRVELVEMEIELGALAALRPGDILRTTHRLDTPLSITSPDSPDGQSRSLIFTGFLGKKGEECAVELLSQADRPTVGRQRSQG